MTKSIYLGTSYNKEDFIAVASELGFTETNPIDERMGMNTRNHATIKGLRLQIHGPSYLEGVEGIVTGIEFDDTTNRFPDHPEAVEALKSLYERVPDLVYMRTELFEEPVEVAPLSELLT